MDLLRKLATRSFSLQPYLADCGIRTTSARGQVVTFGEATGNYLPVLEGKQVGRYWCKPAEVAVRLDSEHDLFRSKDEKYQRAQFVIRQTAAYPIVGPHEHATYFRNSLHGLFAPATWPDIVGVLNSKLIRFAYAQTIREAQQKAFPQVKLAALAKLPMKAVDSTCVEGKASHDRIVSLVTQILDWHRQLRTQEDPAVRTAMMRQVLAADTEIDAIVYELYGLTADEKEIVEATVAKLAKPPALRPTDVALDVQ
ncbi:MAG: TaqI-like C-terminal specificity domain-containing protein [Myxococcales bacterium]